MFGFQEPLKMLGLLKKYGKMSLSDVNPGVITEVLTILGAPEPSEAAITGVLDLVRSADQVTSLEDWVLANQEVLVPQIKGLIANSLETKEIFARCPHCHRGFCVPLKE